MQSGATLVVKHDRIPQASGEFRSGVSLHSHTMHSREYLGRLPHYIAKIPVASYVIEREVGWMHLYEGRTIDFGKMYWTPPLSPREAFDLERKPVEEKLGLQALVSLSDHDNLEAGLHLQMLERTKRVPVAVEWSVPYDQTVFHLGVHNLPLSRATAWMGRVGAIHGHSANRRVAAVASRAECRAFRTAHPESSVLGRGKRRHRSASGFACDLLAEIRAPAARPGI